MNEIDPKALKILLDYDLLNPEATSPEDFDYACKAGLMFPDVTMTHDEIVAAAIAEFKKADKASVADAFLVGIGQNIPYYRAALSAHAVMTHFPDHSFKSFTTEVERTHCGVCAIYEDQKVRSSFLNRCRWNGCIVSREPDWLYFYLRQHNQDAHPKPTDDDIRVFIDFLDAISASDAAETPTTLSKRLRKLKIVKLSVEESRYLLDTLGYCGILQSGKHRGFIDRYTNYLSPRKSRSSDWGYPVDFWTGEDGIDIDALQYWFGSYPAIRDWRPCSKV